tara:strand:- start:1770 stop:2414 length:645 start_codon:yes stop_codon:yes gene_type:complete
MKDKSILLFTYHNSPPESIYHDLYERTAPLFKEYAIANNYEYKHTLIDDVDKRTCILRKPSLITKQLQSNYEYIIYSDIDIVIKDPTYNIFDESKNLIHKDITISSDAYGLCAGFMIIKNTKFSRVFFNTCTFLKPTTKAEQPDEAGAEDQGMIKYLYSEYPHIRQNINGKLSEGVVSNAHSSESNIRDSFAHHYWWNHRTKENIDKVLNELKP